jgi:LysR family transcriptional regulator (chromosome initiation inhibitor)
MRIDNAQLSAFAAVVSEGTFELAARKLHVTASAISQRIKLLEDRLGQVLIQRSTPCQPTAAGRVVLRYAAAVQLLETEMLTGLGVPLEGSAATVRLPIAENADSLDSGIALDVRTEDQDHSVALLLIAFKY